MTATIRRTLSPVPRPSGESTSCAVGSPLSKCSSCYTPTSTDNSSFASTQFTLLYRFQTFMLNLFSRTTSRSIDKHKSKSNAWRRSFFHFFICFLVGIFVGFTPIVSIKTSTNVMSRNQAFSFEKVEKVQLYDADADADVDVNHVMSTNILVANNDSNRGMIDLKQENETMNDIYRDFGKLLIIVTTPMRYPMKTRYLDRLANTLKLVEPPLLWVVVEMSSQSLETSELLRKSGVMFRHLVCTKNTSEIKDSRVHQRNVALSHIETHRLDGIVFFADDSYIYSTQLFRHMRQIRRFGTWQVAKLKKNTRITTFVGPLCNGTQVIGWHTNNIMRRYHADLSGFAFNSTILWDPNRWHRDTTTTATITTTFQHIRHLDTIKEFQVSSFIEQVVEDEREMEGIPENCSEVLVWHLPVEVNQLTSFNTTIFGPL